MADRKRMVIFGIDGVPPTLIEDLVGRGVMPHFGELLDEGTFRRMGSSVPDISSVSWSSIVTGVNPGEHGIFGFTHLIPGTYTMSFPDFTALRAPPFWNSGPEGRTYVIVNVPFTFPAQELPGFLVSGFVALDLERAVYPSSYLDVLQGMGYSIDVDARKGEMSKDLFVRDLFETLETRGKAMRYLWDEFAWDTFMFVVTGSDRIGHLMWDAYGGVDHPHHEDFLGFFSRVDDLIGEVVGRLGEDDGLIILSDHGMELIERRVNVNTALVDAGLLSLGEEARLGLRNVLPGSQAFAMDPGRIHVNLEGRYPRGSVPAGDRSEVVEQIVDALSGLTCDGRRVVEDIHRAEDIYRGPHMEQAPDLVLTPATGFSLHANTTPGPLFEEDRLMGKHTPDAFLYVRTGDAGLVPADPCVEDVIAIMDMMEGGEVYETPQR